MYSTLPNFLTFTTSLSTQGTQNKIQRSLQQHIKKITAAMEKSTNPITASSQPPPTMEKSTKSSMALGKGSATTGKCTNTSTAPELPLEAPPRKYTRPELRALYVAEHPNPTSQEMNAFSRLIFKETQPGSALFELVPWEEFVTLFGPKQSEPEAEAASADATGVDTAGTDEKNA
jgi:hypothetical protein